MPNVAKTAPRAPKFGSFTLLAKLAHGDIGDLFLARSLGAGGFEKLVVIKRIHPELTSDPEIAQLFLAEARNAANIAHPNIRLVYEIGQNEANYYVALEYLEGVPLVDVLLSRRKHRRLADSRLFVTLLAQACQGLHAAHAIQPHGKRLVHGDINPRTIFVTASGTAKILDLDLIEMRDSLAKRHNFTRRTNAYLSPEEVTSGQCDHRGDIFSMGVVAWECLTGRRLFKQDTPQQTFAAIVDGAIPTPKSLRPEMSDELNATVMRALTRDPTLRYGTASDFGAALERAALSEGPPLPPASIAGLMEEAFASEFAKQKMFVRKARAGLGPALLTNQHDISAEDSEGETAHSTSDWGDDNAATRVVQYGESQAILPDPFRAISAQADFSKNEGAPQFQDTHSLVLSELQEAPNALLPSGAVQQAPLPIQAPAPAAVEPAASSFGQAYQGSPLMPPMPSSNTPELQPTPANFSQYPTDERLATIDSLSTLAPATADILPQQEVRESQATSDEHGLRKPAMVFAGVAFITAMGTITALMLVREDTERSNSSARYTAPQTVQSNVSPDVGAGAAASILAAARQSDAGPTIDANLWPSSPDAQNTDAQDTDAQDTDAQDTDAQKRRRNDRRTKTTRRDRKRPDSTDSDSKSSKEPGYLTVSAIPYATVYVDGKKRGITPLVKLGLKPGKHRIRLVSSVDGTQQKMSIQIVSDREVRRKVTF